MISDIEYDLGIDERDHGLSILKSFGSLREKEFRCDLTIKVGKNKLKVNRELMIVASGYIRAIFAHDTLEKQTGVINMKDVEFEFVKKCIDFIYTGKISISLNKCERLLYVACLMQLWTLREYIGLFLKKHLAVSSFFNIRGMAVKFSIENLTNLCNEFAYDNMDMIAKEKELADLDIESVLSVVKVKMSKSPGGEDSKVSLILNWIKHDVGNRKPHLVVMLQSVELKNVSQCYSRNLIENEPICYESAECARMFYLAAMDNQGVKRRRLDLQPYGEPNNIVVFDRMFDSLRAFSRRTVAKIHDINPDMIGNNFAAVSIRSYIYVLMENKRCFKLNFIEKDSPWIPVCEMSEEHGKYITAASLNDFIYVVGNNSIERYSLREDRWEKINSDGVCLDRCGIVGFRDSVYAIGGHAGQSVKAVNKLSPSSLTWSSAEPITDARSEFSAAACNHKITIAGGNQQMPLFGATSYCEISSGEYYNSEKSTWTLTDSVIEGVGFGGFGASASNKPRFGLEDLCCISSAVVLEGKIYGHHPQTGAWGIVGDLPCKVVRPIVPVWLPQSKNYELNCESIAAKKS